MTRTTKEQRQAIAQVFARTEADRRLQRYRSFRRMAVLPTFGCDGAVAVRFAGMILCIEKDGYTHS